MRRLVERFDRAQFAQIRHRPGVRSGPVGHVGIAEHRCRPPVCHLDRRGMITKQVDVGQGVAAPEPQRLLVPVACQCRVGVGGIPRLPGQLLERGQVELTRPGVQPVAAPAFGRDQFRRSVVENRAQTRHIASHLGERARRRSLAPQPVDDRLAVRDRAVMQGQQAEHRALPGRPQRQRRPIAAGRQRTEDADVHATAGPEHVSQVRSLPMADAQHDGQFFHGSPAGKTSAPLLQVAQRAEADPGRRGQLPLGHPLSLAVPLDQRAYPGHSR